MECVIAISTLKLTDESHATDYFEKYRFEYEERAEQLIEEESYNSAGQIEVELVSFS